MEEQLSQKPLFAAGIKNKMRQWAHQAVYEPISSRPLAAFRIAFAAILMIELMHIIYKRDLFFLEFPLKEHIPAIVDANLCAFGIALICLAVGLLTPVAAVVTYLYIVHFFPCNTQAIFCYHADMIYVCVAFLSIFLPLNRSWSVDNVLLRAFFNIDLSQHAIPRIYNNALILFGIGFMYLDSCVYKLQSPFWLDGLGFWVPASFPSFTMFDWNVVLNQEWLVKIAGYLVLILELGFVFLFWIPRMRPYLFTIGLILHVGIAVTFPIPLFGLIMVALFLGFFPDPALNCLVPAFAAVPRLPILQFDQRMSKFVLYLMAALVFLQFNVTANCLIFDNSVYAWLQDYVGITRHSVFGQWQFTTMKHDVALVYVDKTGKEEWIPCVTKDGFTGSEVYGRFWSFWWLTSLPDRPGHKQLWARVAEAWAKRTGHDLSNGYVLVKTKPLLTKLQWERDRFEQQRNIPWQDDYKITWISGERQFQPLGCKAELHI
jgi:hypothetical protein